MGNSNQTTEKYLNRLYSSMYNEEEILEHFAYLKHPSRGMRTTDKMILKYYRRNEMGRFLRIYDITAFECAKSDYIPK